MYMKAKMLSCGYQLVLVSHIHYEVLLFACLTLNKARYLQGGVATPLYCCFVVALFQLCTYTTFEYLVCILLHVDSLHKHYNFTEI